MSTIPKQDSEVCKVIIKTSENSENYISGGLIKQSVEGWIEQDKIIYNIEKNYNKDQKTYKKSVPKLKT